MTCVVTLSVPPVISAMSAAPLSTSHPPWRNSCLIIIIITSGYRVKHPELRTDIVLFLIFSKVLKRIESGYEDQDTMDSRQTEMPPGGDGDQ